MHAHASLFRQVGIDPKLVADQLGHGLGVNLDVYTIAALDKRQNAVEVLGIRTGASRFGLKVRNCFRLGWTPPIGDCGGESNVILIYKVGRDRLDSS
jgi:hypothetical protein